MRTTCCLRLFSCQLAQSSMLPMLKAACGHALVMQCGMSDMDACKAVRWGQQRPHAQAGAGLASLAARWRALKLGGPAGELRVSRLAGTRGPALAVRRITMCMPCLGCVKVLHLRP